MQKLLYVINAVPIKNHFLACQYLFVGAKIVGCVESQEVVPKRVHIDALIRGYFSRRFYVVSYVRLTSLLFIPDKPTRY